MQTVEHRLVSLDVTAVAPYAVLSRSSPFLSLVPGKRVSYIWGTSDSLLLANESIHEWFFYLNDINVICKSILSCLTMIATIYKVIQFALLLSHKKV